MKKDRVHYAVIIALLTMGGTVVSAFYSWWVYNVHKDITETAIGFEFVDKGTLKQIFNENKGADSTDNGKYFDHALHFDNEEFEEGCWKLAFNLNTAIDYLSACEKPKALEKIGEALHALQDFYSHSNWVENHLFNRSTIVLSDIAIYTGLVSLRSDGVFIPGPLVAAPNFQDTCNPNPPDPPVSTLVSGYDPPVSKPANKCLHLEVNKDYDDANVTLKPETSSPRGAFVVNNKTLHAFAKDVATRHTQALWQDFKQAFRLRFGQEQGEKYYNNLVGTQRNAAFAIDVSGSMSEELPVIQTKLCNWANGLTSDPDEAPRLSLVTFTDTTVNVVGTTCDPTEFAGWVKPLTPGPEETVSKTVLDATLEAGDLAGSGGTVILLTDAVIKEGADVLERAVVAEGGGVLERAVVLEPADVTEALRRKRVKVCTIWNFPACGALGATQQGGDDATVPALLSPVCGIGAEFANATGGISIPSFADLNLALNEVLEISTPGLRDFAHIVGAVTTNELGPIPVPVDGSGQRLDLIVTSPDSWTTHTLVLKRPDNSLVVPSDPDVAFVSTPTFSSVRVTAPTPGEWKVYIQGNGDFQLSAMGLSDLVLFDAVFLKEVTAVCSDGPPVIIPIEGPLSSGQQVEVEIDLLGEIFQPTFELVGRDGSVIGALDVQEDVFGLGTYSGTYLPTEGIDLFRIRVRGTGPSGETIQRILPRSFSVFAPVTGLDCNNNGVADRDDFQKRTPTDGAAGDQFGGAVAMTSIDGTRALVGAPYAHDEDGDKSGAAYVFRREDGGTPSDPVDDYWVEESKLLGGTGTDGDVVGTSVALAGDRAIIGGDRWIYPDPRDAGSAYVFRREGTAWVEEAKLQLQGADRESYSAFGASVAISADAGVAAVGAHWDLADGLTWAGAVYVFRRNGVAWSQDAKLIAWDRAPLDEFGYSLSMYGTRLLVGAPYADRSQKIDSGAVYVFSDGGSSWPQEQELVPTDPASGASFGFSVAMSGDVIAVSAPTTSGGGSVYLFRLSGGSWFQEAILKASDHHNQDEFGHSVSISGDLLLVGARQDGLRGVVGKVYLFQRQETGWIEVAPLPSDAYYGRAFGTSVAITGDFAVAGNFYDEAVYLYDLFVLDCDADGIPNACELASGVSHDYNGNALPDECEAKPLSDVVNPDKSRFVSFFAPSWPSGCGSTPETALRVRLVSLHHVDPPYPGGASVPYTAFEGQVRWVGPPVAYVESVSSGLPFLASKLQCDPYYYDWSSLPKYCSYTPYPEPPAPPIPITCTSDGDCPSGTTCLLMEILHVTGSAIVPSSVYEVENVAVSCQGNEETCTLVSAPLTIKTTRWGDIESPFNPPSPATQPDFTDIGALVNKFKSAPGAPIKARAMLAGEGARGLINLLPDLGFGHLSACIDGFKGLAYPYKVGKCTNAQTTGCTTDTDCGANGPCILCP